MPLGIQRVCSKTALRQRPGPAPPPSPATHTATAAAHAALARGGKQLTGGRKRRRHSGRRSCTLGSAAYSPTSAETAPPRPQPQESANPSGPDAQAQAARSEDKAPGSRQGMSLRRGTSRSSGPGRRCGAGATARPRESRIREPRPWDLPRLECEWAVVSCDPERYTWLAATCRRLPGRRSRRASPARWAPAAGRPRRTAAPGKPRACRGLVLLLGRAPRDAGPGQGALPGRRLPRHGLLALFQLLHAAGPVPGGHHVEAAPGGSRLGARADP